MDNSLIKRQAAIDAICTEGTRLERNGTVAMAEIKQWCVDILDALPSAQPETCAYWDRESNICALHRPSAQPEQKYTLEEVAEILSSVIGDECACNINGIDEWLPERCKYTEIGEECPNPKEKHGCWMQFLLQGGGAYMRGEQE